MLKKFIFSLLFLLITPSISFAQTKPQLTVSPSIIDIDLAIDKPQATISYTNETNKPMKITLSAQDFSELEDGYKLKFLDQKEAANYKYSLSSWITFENNNLELAPHEKKDVNILIDSNRLTRGGHYATIQAEIVQEKTNKPVLVRAILSSLLFVRANTGYEKEEGQIVSFGPSRDGIELPQDFVVRFQNSGNVVVVPYGLIKITNPLGQLISKTVLNQDSLQVLPESIRRFDVTVAKPDHFSPPGIYTAKINMHFGKSNTNIEKTVTFFSQGSINLVLAGIIIAAVLVIFLLIRWWRKPNNKTTD
ncbi:MAG TPA: hypothetical protein VG917_01515 [Patescibacteria group bacterium]|nr:hypothetical protein [Patescibacteria group bacterium]